MAGRPSERLASLGITLPPPPRPIGTYAPVVVDGERAYVSGQTPTRDGAILHPGLVDREVSISQALSALQEMLGSLDRVRRVLRVGVFVSSSPGFTRQHEVANGATELLM